MTLYTIYYTVLCITLPHTYLGRLLPALVAHLHERLPLAPRGGQTRAVPRLACSSVQ